MYVRPAVGDVKFLGCDLNIFGKNLEEQAMLLLLKKLLMIVLQLQKVGLLILQVALMIGVV